MSRGFLKAAAVLLLVFLVLPGFATGGKEKSGAAEGETAAGEATYQGKIGIVMGGQPPAPGQEKSEAQLIWEGLTKKWEARHPGVTVETVYIPAADGGISAWVSSRQATSQMPEIVNLWDIPTTTQEAKGEAPYVSLTEAMNSSSPYTGKPWKEDFAEDMYGLMKLTLENVYGVFLSMEGWTWFYNKEIFDEVGITPPNNVTEFFSNMDKLQAAGYTPLAWADTFAGGVNTVRTWGPALTAKMLKEAYGGDLRIVLDAAELELWADGSLTYKDPGMRKAWELHKKMAEYAPKGWMGMDPMSVRELFTTGKAAIHYDAASYLREMDTLEESGLLDFEYGVFPFPDFDLKADAAILEGIVPELPTGDIFSGTAYWLVPAERLRERSSPEVTKLAIDFLQFMTAPEQQAVYAEKLYLLPINLAVEVKDPRLAAFMPKEGAFVNSAIHFKWFVDWVAWASNWQGYMLGNLTYDEYAAKMDEANMKEAKRRLEAAGN